MSDQNQSSNAGKSMGIAALVLGILALIIAWIPCVNIFAIAPGILAIIFGAVGWNQAKKASASAGMPLTGLILGIISIAVTLIVYFTVYAAAADKLDDLNDAVDQYNDAMEQYQDAVDDLN